MAPASGEQVLGGLSGSVQQDRKNMTGRPLFSMLIFAGIIVAAMWFFVLPALTTFRPTLP